MNSPPPHTGQRNALRATGSVRQRPASQRLWSVLEFVAAVMLGQMVCMVPLGIMYAFGWWEISRPVTLLITGMVGLVFAIVWKTRQKQRHDSTPG